MLGDHGISREVDRIESLTRAVPLAGFYTYGEIARTHGTGGFHNRRSSYWPWHDEHRFLLAEFLAAVSAAADDEDSMLHTGLELAAEAVDAEVGAIVVRGRPSITLGYGDEVAPAA